MFKSPISVSRLFNLVCGVDGTVLLLPTSRLGPMAEFWIALALDAATAVLWGWLKLSSDDGGSRGIVSSNPG